MVCLPHEASGRAVRGGEAPFSLPKAVDYCFLPRGLGAYHHVGRSGRKQLFVLPSGGFVVAR